MELYNKIRLLRILNGDDQRDIALALGMKSATHVNRWERNISKPRTDMLKRLGTVLNVYWAWLADSTSRFSDDKFVYYRPLSPFATYSPRWLALMPLDLEKLLPEFFNEIAFNQFWFFEASCGGGIAVANKLDLTLVIICHPHISSSVKNSMSSPQIISISNYIYASNLFWGEGINKIYDLCGIEQDINSEKTNQDNKMTDTLIDMSLKAKLAVGIDKDEIKIITDNINNFIDNIVKEYELTDIEFKNNISESKTKNEILLELVNDKKLKNIALDYINARLNDK
jgi:transcriptional regulator with XRE-family HTH domain